MSPWDEPFIVMVDPDEDGTVRCGIGEHEGQVPCRRRVKWQVETVGWNGHGPVPDDSPTDHVCTLHLATVLTARLELRRSA